MRGWLGLGVSTALACVPPSSHCGDGTPEVGVFCFPERAVVHVGHGFAPEAMQMLDVDGDGALDLAAVNPRRQTLSVTWGGADGGLERLTSWPIGQQVAGLACADLDGDGTIDLATALPDGDAVAVLYQRGARAFVHREHATGDTPRNVIAAALVPGEPPALVTANVGDGSLGVLRRGVVGAPVVVGPAPFGLAAGDVDGDGSVDIAVTLRERDAVQVMRNLAGVLVPGALHPVGAVPGALVAADLDEDGSLDLATADELGDTISVIHGDGAGGARDIRTWPVSRQPAGLVVVRGGDEPAALGVLSGETYEVMQLDPRTGDTTTAAPLAAATAIAAGRVDGGGRERLVYGADERGAVGSLAPGQGLRAVTRWQTPTFGAFSPVDVGGDGVDEIVVTPEMGALALWRGPEDAWTAETWPSGLERVSDIQRGDFNGDGLEDLLVQDSPPASTVATLLVLVQEAGAFRAVGEPVKVDGWVGGLVLGDVGGDGTLDGVINLWASSGSGIMVVRGDGAGGLAPAQPIGLQVHGDMVAADLDGDAALDLVALADDTVAIFEDVEPGAKARLLSLSEPVYSLFSGDLTGDGIDEILVCMEEAMAQLSLDTGALVKIPGSPSGGHCSDMLLHDLDADGDVDVLLRSFHELKPGPRFSHVLLTNDGLGGLTVAAPSINLGSLGALQVVHGGAGGVGLAGRANDRFEVLDLAVGPVLVETPQVELGRAMAGQLGDLDGDGRTDWLGSADMEIAVSFGRDGGLGPTHHVPLAGLVDADVTEVVSSVQADLDRDGAEEVIVLGEVESPSLPLRSLSRVRVDAAGQFRGEPITRLVGEITSVQARDLDGDGAVDLLMLEKSDTGLDVTRLRGRGDGSFDAAVSQQIAVPTYVGGGGLAELDGDDRFDMVLRVEQGLMVASGQRGGDFDEPRPWFIVPGRVHFGAGAFADFDGDQEIDLVYEVPSGLMMVRGDGERASGAARRIFEHGALGMFTAADLDGDGVSELMILSDALEGSSLWTGRHAGGGRFVFEPRALPKVAGHVGPGLTVRDIDGDDRPDIVVHGEWGLTIVRQQP